ncbi:MAG: ribbon-helix-helix domain-containing protein [Pseudonocardiales bacterium]|nr:ribbon-helix-helix domain-containing protein [Pseudonocardiales bacterium]
MSMEWLQILLRSEQVARLRDVSQVQGVPVAELVREAIDQIFPYSRAPQRRASWARFNALPVVTPAPDPEALEAVLDDRVDKLLPPGVLAVIAYTRYDAPRAGG